MILQMKISVFNCPGGITEEGALRAFQDAGLPAPYLKKEFSKNRVDPKTRNLLNKLSRQLGNAGIGGKEAFDSLVSAAGVTQALCYFGIEKCFVRRIAIGKKGNPRTLKLLRGFILERLPINKEIVTPAGAAILAAFCEKDDAIPSMKLESVGEGPNKLRISIGETVAPYRRERILLLETNIDDMNPQGFELLYSRLFKAGALDVWVEPILMKKMRPAFKLSVLLDHPAREKISGVIFKETPTLGLRFLELDRFSLPRKIVRVKTKYGTVRTKVGRLDSKHSVLNPEYEDVKKICERSGRSFGRVYEELKKEICSRPSHKM